MPKPLVSAKVDEQIQSRIESLAKARRKTVSETAEKLLRQALDGCLDLAKLDRIRSEAQAAAGEAVRDRLQAVGGLLASLRDRKSELEAEAKRLSEEADSLRVQTKSVGAAEIGAAAARLRELDDALDFVRGLVADCERRIGELEAEKRDLEREALAVYAENFEQNASLALQDQADWLGEQIVAFSEALLQTLSEVYVLTPGQKRRILRQLDLYLAYVCSGKAHDPDVIAHYVAKDIGTAHLLRDWQTAWGVWSEGLGRRGGGRASA